MDSGTFQGSYLCPGFISLKGVETVSVSVSAVALEKGWELDDAYSFCSHCPGAALVEV